MKKRFTFILLPITLMTCGEFMMKHNINNIPKTTSHELLNIKMLMTSAPVLLGILCIISGSIFWLVAMSKYELSFLYPFLSINYTAIIIGSQLFLGEPVSIARYVSVGFICIGLYFISRSPYSSSQKE